MFTIIMKWLSAVSLLFAVFWRSSANFQLFLQVVICVAALLVFSQALRSHKYAWAAGFLVITVLFNPVAPVTLPGRFYFLLDVSCLLAFLASVVALRPKPVLSILSITGRRTGSESL
ncbi:MAG: DUF6804 family protein [Deltaproteobacteria bacterium]